MTHPIASTTPITQSRLFDMIVLPWYETTALAVPKAIIDAIVNSRYPVIRMRRGGRGCGLRRASSVNNKWLQVMD
jgi:hypothetical protein